MTHRGQLRGRRVFVTGHTGFKGAWLVMLLDRLGAAVTGYSLPPVSGRSLFDDAKVGDFLVEHVTGDVHDAAGVAAAIRRAQPDVILHLAAQPLVLLSHRQPFETFATNVMGTAAVLDAVRGLAAPCAVVVVTSDKCYEPRADGRPHTEADRLGGRDPYSASKAAAEIVVAAYRASYFPVDRLAEHGVQVAAVRAGNVIGGGDWAEDRIVTDIVRNLMAGRPVPVRHPAAIRPWQHVLDPLTGYLELAGSMLADPNERWCGGWNFGPAAGPDIPVRQLVEMFIAAWGSGSWRDVHDPRGPLETAVLRLSIDKACAGLAWRPALSPADAIRRTAAWYRAYAEKPAAARELCRSDIEAHMATCPSPEA